MPRRPSYDRDALIAQATNLFWRLGWSGTSLKTLEHELKLKPGSFYAAFGSKEALYALALDHYAKTGISRLNELTESLGAKGALMAQPRLVVEAASAPVKACMLSKTYAELQGAEHELADRAADHLAAMKACFATLFRQAQEVGDIGPEHDPDRLAARYQSDILGLRLSAERADIDALAIASDIAADIDRL